ncbi:transcription factor bHLH68-like isoform X2 [Diospyros lotus]|uniref:transcription factor bHLH68-like isoform X2 n=1 Tax=Diospyros lotus TaxID=55363 RepID=UPI0022590062|nr:transcription factor bHLH68-like isoform X2 [Diospyros lotus]
MMAGSPNWWSMSSQPHQQASAFLSPCPALFPQYAVPSSSLPSNSLPDHHSQDFPQPWNQLLMGGLGNDEDQDKVGLSHFQSKKLENWEDQILINNPSLGVPIVDVKQEVVQSSPVLYGNGDDEFQQALPSWSKVAVTTINNNNNSNNILDFSNCKRGGKNQHADHSSECDSTVTAGLSKKARAQSSSTQPPLKVRKEKLGDRITALHQLVSPFGKTDTASVLLEAIGYIRFLQGQIEALSSPYMSNASRHQHSAVQGERNCAFLEDSAQLLFDNCLKRRAPKQGNQDGAKDLRSRGLCLVPISCTHHVGSENGADYWAPAPGGGF